jgi:hypothetical protein
MTEVVPDMDSNRPGECPRSNPIADFPHCQPSMTVQRDVLRMLEDIPYQHQHCSTEDQESAMGLEECPSNLNDLGM